MSCIGTEAIDLSLKPGTPSSKPSKTNIPSILRPTPRPAWSILWYQSLWPTSSTNVPPGNNSTSVSRSSYGKVRDPLDHTTPFTGNDSSLIIEQGGNRTSMAPKHGQQTNQSEDYGVDLRFTMEMDHGKEDDLSVQNVNSHMAYIMTQGFASSIVLDVASCDGPVRFERVSNPNFALTVEHHQSNMKPIPESDEPALTLSSRTYICIYCKQGFKSLFCYQKHKKRHLNPVSVDITASNTQSSTAQSETTSQTRDLNVQFFPCKECGCKFPSYYFVHKHKKICHKQ